MNPDGPIAQLLAYIGAPERFRSVKALTIVYGVLRSGKPFDPNRIEATKA